MQLVRNHVEFDVQALRSARVADVREEFEELLAWVIGEEARVALHRFDVELHQRVMSLGLQLVNLWLAHRLPDVVVATFTHGKSWYRYLAQRGRDVRTRFGTSWWIRPLYVLSHGDGPRTVAPVDREVGLAAGSMSLTVHLLAANMASRMSYEEGHEVTELFGDYAPSTRSTQGIVERLGPVAARHMEELEAPHDDGEIIVVEGDAKGVPHVDPEEHKRRCRSHKKRGGGPASRGARKQRRRLARNGRKRKQVGDKSKNARMFTAFVVYTLRQHGDGTIEGPLNRRVFATFDGPTKAAKLALRDARKRGYGTKETLFLADGASHLWKLWRRYFRKARPCLDWYHASEYLWSAGSGVHGAKSEKRTPWVKARLAELMHGDVEAVINALVAARDAIAGNASKRRLKKVTKALRYVRNHRVMMTAYGELNARNLTYGTGLIEGTIKYIGARLDGCGMRWSKEGSSAMLPLRCVLLSGEWEQFEERARQAHEAVTSLEVQRITRPGRRTPHKAAKKAGKKAA